MFSDSLLDGGYGEHAIWNLFIKQPWVRNVIDVRDDKGFQEKDIDFLVEDRNRQFTPIEVKTDYKAHETGNVVYELSTSNNIGCFEKTQAKYIMYFVPKSKEAHMIDVKEFRTYLQKARPDERKMGDHSTGFLLSIQELKDNGVIKRTYEGVM